jgi:hypothetical protein
MESGAHLGARADGGRPHPGRRCRQERLEHAVSQQSLLSRHRQHARGPAAVARPGLRAVSLFSGAGGLDIGVERAGYAVAFAVENDPTAVATLNRNRARYFPALGEVAALDITTLDPLRVMARAPSLCRDVRFIRSCSLGWPNALCHFWATAAGPKTCFHPISPSPDRNGERHRGPTTTAPSGSSLARRRPAPPAPAAAGQGTAGRRSGARGPPAPRTRRRIRARR